jgi:RecQ family ATP-dependent DNA helicase
MHPTDQDMHVRQAGPLDSALPNRDDLLHSTLLKTFGHPHFREGQEDVCRVFSQGRDGLLVMPTGSGKSLCYQLPALVRGGVALVVSPLVSLIEDQVQKLKALGVAAEALHAGLTREEARAVCRRYLKQELSFLFVAPERFSVPGFPDMLRKVPISLVAIDEAHCISHWGHDFRPAYRMLGPYLDRFRPAPFLALTATATPEVQDDIVAQIGMRKEARFIRGFRRKNLHLEAVPLSPGLRYDAIAALLGPPEARPAIVYANARREAEAIAEKLRVQGFRIGVYHAGLEADARQTVQSQFQSGEVDVVAATVAFGMGIDKADVRTVVHAGMPASVEGYYQEVGRAGRDGLPARAVLLHSYVDVRTHEFLLGKSYPEVVHLASMMKIIGDESRNREWLFEKLRSLDEAMNEEAFERLLDHAWVHDGIEITEDGSIQSKKSGVVERYERVRKARFEKLQTLIGFLSTTMCKMQWLVRHFGDEPGSPCGNCDSCAPDRAIASALRQATAKEVAMSQVILDELGGKCRSTGQLATQLAGKGLTRDTLSHLLHAMAHNQLVSLESATFERDGKRIHFQRVRPLAEQVEPGSLSVRQTLHGSSGHRSEGRNVSSGRERSAGRSSGAALPSMAAEARKARRSSPTAQDPLFLALRAWRLETSKSEQVPAFRVVTDASLHAIVSARPRSLASLVACQGIGKAIAKKYGQAILRVVAETPA